MPPPFTFAGRIGRMTYFLTCVGLTLSAAIPIALVVSAATALKSGRTAGIVVSCLLIVIYAIAFCWASFATMVRRVRDIGWNPMLVLAVSIGSQLCDPVLARLVPSLAIGPLQASTPVALAVQAGLGLALLFWPGDGGVDAGDTPAAPERRVREWDEGPIQGGAGLPLSASVALGPSPSGPAAYAPSSFEAAPFAVPLARAPGASFGKRRPAR